MLKDSNHAPRSDPRLSFPCPPDSYSQELAADNCLHYTLTLDKVASFKWTHTLNVRFASVEAANAAHEITGWPFSMPLTLEATISRTEGYDSHPAVVVKQSDAIASQLMPIDSAFVAFCGVNVVAG